VQPVARVGQWISTGGGRVRVQVFRGLSGGGDNGLVVRRGDEVAVASPPLRVVDGWGRREWSGGR
jgi:hypothetical protein